MVVDLLLAGSGPERQHGIVERSLHLKGGFHHPASHPEDGETAIVRNDVPLANLIDELGRERDTEYLQILAFAIEYRLDTISRLQVTHIREPVADKDFVRSG